MIVAGIDPSLTGTGIAILNGGKVAHLQKIKSSPDGKSDVDRAARVVALRHLIVQTVRAYKPQLIVIESPAYSQGTGSACDRNALWHYLVHEFGVAGKTRGEKYSGISPTNLKRFVTGNGAAGKPLMCSTVQGWYPAEPLLRHWHGKTQPDDNIADAVGLAVMGAKAARDPIPFELRRVQLVAWEVNAWPVMV